MQKKTIEPLFSARMNIITAVCLGLFTLSTTLNILSDGYQFGPSIMWMTLSNAFKSGILELNLDAIGLSLFGYLLLGIWSLISFLLALVANLRKKQDGKKQMVWALVLLGVIIFIMVCLTTVGQSCVPLFPYGSSPVCALPISPAISGLFQQAGPILQSINQASFASIFLFLLTNWPIMIYTLR